MTPLRTTPIHTAPSHTAPSRPAGPVPSVHLRAAFTWLAVYVMIMATQTLLGPLLGALSLPVRTLVVTGVVVPTVVYALVPAILRAYAALRRRTR
jgi:antibiotic biosynthesis monooxygenase (ABM) superfamily enzyme